MVGAQTAEEEVGEGLIVLFQSVNECRHAEFRYEGANVLALEIGEEILYRGRLLVIVHSDHVAVASGHVFDSGCRVAQLAVLVESIRTHARHQRLIGSVAFLVEGYDLRRQLVRDGRIQSQILHFDSLFQLGQFGIQFSDICRATERQHILGKTVVLQILEPLQTQIFYSHLCFFFLLYLIDY